MSTYGALRWTGFPSWVCSWDRLWIHRDADQDKVLTEDGEMGWSDGCRGGTGIGFRWDWNGVGLDWAGLDEMGLYWAGLNEMVLGLDGITSGRIGLGLGKIG